jgi:hypothetical protein
MLAVGIVIACSFSGWAAAGKIDAPAVSEAPTPERPLQDGAAAGLREVSEGYLRCAAL